jgi:hypothetical protein
MRQLEISVCDFFETFSGTNVEERLRNLQNNNKWTMQIQKLSFIISTHIIKMFQVTKFQIITLIVN